MASAGSIFVDLLLRDANYVQGLNRARGRTRQFSSGVEGDIGKVRQSFASTLSPVNNIGAAVAKLSGILAGALSTQKIVQYSDTWKQLEGRLSIVSSGMGEVVKTQGDLFEIAQRTRQPLEGIMSFYTRLTQFIPEAERAQYDLLGVTESVASALAITGESGASASAAMIQFTQAIGTNFEAAGQELRSLQEQAPRLTKALMDALGGGTKSLQQLKDEGLLTRESVLRALSGMGEEGRKMADELAKVSLTVGQAFGRLDNAFLKFIGQSEQVRDGTNTIAQSISFLAENLEILAKSIIVVASIFVARFIGPVVAGMASYLISARAMSVANAQVAATSAVAASEITRAAGATQFYAVAAGNSARMAAALAKAQAAAAGSYGATTIAVNTAGVAIARTTGIMAVAAKAARGLSAALLFIGGIPGLVIGSVAALVIFRKQILDISDNINVFGTTAGQVFRDIGEGARIIFFGTSTVIIGTISGMVEAFRGHIDSMKVMVYGFIQDLNKIPGVNIDASSILEDLSQPGAFERSQRTVAENFKKGWDKVSVGMSDYLARSLYPVENGKGIGPKLPPGSASSDPEGKENKRIEKWLIKQREALETMRQEIDYIGLTSVEVEKLKDARQFEAQVAERAYGLKGKELEQFKAQAEAIKLLRQEIIQTNYDAARTAEAGFKEFSSKYVEDATNMATAIKTVLEGAFKSAEDAFIEFTKTGKLNFRDMANSIIDDILRIQFRKAAAGLVEAATGSGGIFGHVLGGLFGGPSLSQGSIDLAKGGGLFSFDVGTNYVPRDMVANIHKGEMIIPAYDAEKMRNGGMGGNNVTVNVINNSQSNVRTEERDNGNGMELMVMIDEAVARNMGTPGTRTNQALGAFNNRGLIRR